MRFVFRVLYDAFMRFSQDDGWAIASHIALSILTSMFPFLIFVTALAGFFGTKSLADEVAHIYCRPGRSRWQTSSSANEIHSVLTQTRSDLLTISVILAVYFSSSGVEAVRTGLNRAYDVRDSRPWWLLRLESIAYIFVGAFALLTLAFLVVLAPLIWEAVLHFAPGLEPLNRLITFGRFAIASLVLLLALVLAHKFLPAGRRSLGGIAPGILLTCVMWMAAGIAFGSFLARIRAQLCHHLRGPRLGDDCACVSLHDCFHFHLRRRIKCGDPARETQKKRRFEG